MAWTSEADRRVCPIGKFVAVREAKYRGEKRTGSSIALAAAFALSHAGDIAHQSRQTLA